MIACYALDTRAVCAPATFYCWSMWSVLARMCQLLLLFDASNVASYGSAEAKRNFHDIRMPCETNPDCYAELDWMTEYMIRLDVRTALGVDPRAPKFVECNTDMLVEFMSQGDGMRDTKSVVTELVDEGIRLLVYAGNAGAFALHVNYPLPVLIKLGSRFGVQLHG
jgi:cathepsin A (carboxypeptidase C)